MDRAIISEDLKQKNLQKKTAQISLEYSSVFFVLLLLLIGIFAAGTSFFSRFVREKEQQTIEDFLHWLQAELSYASLMEEGYQRTIALPPSLLGDAYALVHQNTTLVMLYKNQSYAIPVPFFQGTLVPNTTILIKKTKQGLSLIPQ